MGQEGSWQVVVGGAGGKGVRKANVLVTVETTEEALETAELFFQCHRENANYLERSYDFVERLGIEKVRSETLRNWRVCLETGQVTKPCEAAMNGIVMLDLDEAHNAA